LRYNIFREIPISRLSRRRQGSQPAAGLKEAPPADGDA
jgi:hypothetical protein